MRRPAISGPVILLGAALLVWPAGFSEAGAQEADADTEAATAAFRAGRYGEALHLYERAASVDGGAVAARRGLVRTLALVGRYREAEREARAALEETGSPDLWNPLGEVLLHRGRLDEAAAAFERADSRGARDSLVARLNLAELRFRRGHRREALATFDSFIDVYNRNRGLPAPVLTAVGTAVRHLGRTNPDLFRDALRAFDEAVAADSAYLDPRIRTGRLFLDKYNSADARRTFQEVLTLNPRHPDALVGLARTLSFDNDAGARETARKALETNPGHVPARAFLARLNLEVERWDDGLEEARRALQTNPASLEALSVLAAAHHLRDDTAAFRRVRARADSLYPDDATLPLTVAELSATQRRYGEAVALARKAMERDERMWQAVGLLGLNQLRTGELEEGRRNLERAFEGDPYNVWFKNTLDLLDTWSEYELRRTPHFEIFVHRDEAEVLAPYVEAVAEEAYRALAAHYRHEPPTPIRIEVYPRHADFSVRTVGLTGIGALGVSFGPVVVLDSPSARDPASFNWASALWHEVAHSFHLSLSRNRVPRWFSEGLAVEDQRRARDGWGHGAGVEFLRAFAADRLPPVSRLNDGFMRPEFPGQVVLSYYQASLVFSYMDDEWGPAPVRRLLRGYGEGRTTGELLPRVLGLAPEELDERFEARVRDRFRTAIPAVTAGEGEGGAPDDRAALERRIAERPDDFVARMRLGTLLEEEGELERAAAHLDAALRLFSDYAGNDGPHWALARVRRAQGRLDDAARHLEALRGINESHLPAALAEAEIRKELGDLHGTAEALERAVEIAPLEIDVHERLAEVYEETGTWERAVREREAVVALAPVDMAEAWYRLARARLGGGDRAGARDAVLRSLERAPRFDEALDLLLEIRSRDEDAEEGVDHDTRPPDPGAPSDGA